MEVASQRWHACIYVTCVVLSFTHINQTRPHTSGGRPADHSSKIHSPPHTRDAQSLTGCCPGPCTPSWFRRLLLRCLGLGLGALVWSLARRLCRVVMGKEGSGPGRSRPRVGGQVRPVASEHGAGRDSIDCVNHVRRSNDARPAPPPPRPIHAEWRLGHVVAIQTAPEQQQAAGALRPH